MSNPTLLHENVVVVAGFTRLPDLPSFCCVCRSWHLALGDDDFWHTVVRRQWVFERTSLGMDVSSWRQVCKIFTTVNLSEWRPIPNPDQLVELRRLDGPVAQFLFGIAHGYVPTSDGVFTYHCSGATPIHYRFIPGLSQYSEASGLRVGGRWEWSPDRETWFSSDTCEINRGLFGSGGWRLVADNSEIVGFLHRWPLTPLILNRLALQEPRANLCHMRLNERPIDDFLNSIASGRRPTTSCVATKTFTIHLHFLPVLEVTCTTSCWALAGSTRCMANNVNVPEYNRLLDCLNQIDGLAAQIYHYDHWFRVERLGLSDDVDEIGGI